MNIFEALVLSSVYDKHPYVASNKVKRPINLDTAVAEAMIKLAHEGYLSTDGKLSKTDEGRAKWKIVRAKYEATGELE